MPLISAVRFASGRWPKGFKGRSCPKAVLRPRNGHGPNAAFPRESSIFWGFFGVREPGKRSKGTCPAKHACVSLALGVVSLCLARGWGFIQRVAGFHAGG